MPSDPYAEHLVADHRRAMAYEAAPAPWRARLKKLIAQLDACQGRDRAGRRERRLAYGLGLAAQELEQAADLAVVAFTAEQAAPARLLAAVWPALAVGVSEVVVAFVGAEAAFPEPALLALELVGVESVLAVPPAEAPGLLAAAGRRTRRGRLLELGDRPLPPEAVPAGWSRWRPSWSRVDAGKPRLGVWLDDGGRESLDLDVLAWAQTGADVAIRPISASLAEPGPGGTDAEVFERFLAEEWDAVVVPESRLDQAAYAAPLVLGPGQEAAWLWPDLHPSFFLERRVLWRDDRRPPAEA